MNLNVKCLELINSDLCFVDKETDHSSKVETRISCSLWFWWAIYTSLWKMLSFKSFFYL